MTDSHPEATETIRVTYPGAAELVGNLRSTMGRLITGPIDWLAQERGEGFWKQAEWLADLSRKMDGNPCESLAEYTVMILKEQIAFQATGEYSASDFDEVRRTVYDNPDVMRAFYLEGLMLTHAFWPIHYDIHTFFRDDFLSSVPEGSVGFELGYGHGLYLLEILCHRQGTSTTSFDISEHSQHYARRLLGVAGIAEDRFDLKLGDAREALDLEDSSQDWAVCAEVLEHIPDPRYALEQLARTLKGGALLFATTVLDSNAIDHLYQFADQEEVKALFAETGFEVVAERVLKVRDYFPKSSDPTVDLAYICRKRIGS